MLRLFYPAERPLDGLCPNCGHALEHIFLDELIDSTLPWRPGNMQKSPRWICRTCWRFEKQPSMPPIEPIPAETSSRH
jgi:hypothetical protein